VDCGVLGYDAAYSGRNMILILDDRYIYTRGREGKTAKR
jgi:hypothetical protein